MRSSTGLIHTAVYPGENFALYPWSSILIIYNFIAADALWWGTIANEGKNKGKLS